jgi:hypothetical protein
MISGEMPHAKARENSINEINEGNDISKSQKRKFEANTPRSFSGYNNFSNGLLRKLGEELQPRHRSSSSMSSYTLGIMRC